MVGLTKLLMNLVICHIALLSVFIFIDSTEVEISSSSLLCPLT